MIELNDQNLKMELARNMFIVRKALGYNHFDLVKLSGLTRPVLSSIENASGNPTLDTLLKLSDSMEIDVKFLLMTKMEFESLKGLLKESFQKENRAEDHFIIPEKIWGELLRLSGTEIKLEQGRIAIICKDLVEINLPGLNSFNRNKITLFASLGVIFQQDGFQLGLEFGAWLGKRF